MLKLQRVFEKAEMGKFFLIRFVSESIYQVMFLTWDKRPHTG